jgi:3,4-dihydroxy 2-butanone 4-phosphate synthase
MPSSTIDQSQFDSIPSAIEAFRNGEFLVVLDDPSRENEADLIIAAQDVTTEQMGFLIHHSSGYVCAPMNAARADALGLALMVPPQASEDFLRTAYTVSVDAADAAVTTGISAHDRALTCRVLADTAQGPDALRRPGHILPLRAVPGGVRQRRGHTEAATEFCRLAGKHAAAAICEIVDDGEARPGQALHSEPGMLRGEACIAFARKWNIKVCTIADLVDYVVKTEGDLQTNGSTN